MKKQMRKWSGNLIKIEVGVLCLFGMSFYGYNKNEVNEFISNVTNEYESMLDKLKQTNEEMKKLRDDNSKLESQLEQYKNIEGTLRRTLALAEESNQTIRKSANDESQAIVEDAKKNASRIINDALLKAQKIQDDADAIKRDTIVYRNRVMNIIKEQKELLDKYDDIEY